MAVMGLQSCWVSRCARPRMYGYVMTAGNKTPLANCIVGESRTDAKGYFELPEKRYHELVAIGGEAPPLYVRETVSKTGYESQTISFFNQYGGSHGKGAVYNADTLFLKKRP